ncbi:hypothetical protein KKC1_06350 [Calderihabitans maritimus]|uniref:Uncharacterized protein n=1 Tax=Calderihabitans maritimus TaxID=1246530 RepID=A0A1Z5HPM5_9FIRM|nr:hypothetical protein KKC1_06350 [Calderihabitans maritimus]
MIIIAIVSFYRFDIMAGLIFMNSCQRTGKKGILKTFTETSYL